MPSAETATPPLSSAESFMLVRSALAEQVELVIDNGALLTACIEKCPLLMVSEVPDSQNPKVFEAMRQEMVKQSGLVYLMGKFGCSGPHESIEKNWGEIDGQPSRPDLNYSCTSVGVRTRNE